MRQECKDCGVCWVLEGERLNSGLARAGWSRTLKDKLLSLGQGTPHVGEKRAKLAFYSKMQEAPESGSSASAGSSFSSHAAASIKEEDCSPEKERPPEAEYISSRCVLFTYFQGDISAVSEVGAAAAWTTPGPFPNATGDMAQSIGLNVDTGLQPQDKSKDLYWF
ncbi:hypothetical protein EK904_012123 [Melospiza melodia maxima]|nr:hypothetical protein EK904_012123 [Melospiza melodia maxima]